ncbi:MAG TPA: acyl carrier protein [Chitinophagales bacterium]|nr:acyl carrier protein [Chitinophagales bacterium]
MEKLITAIREEFNELNTTTLTPDTELRELLGWSSLNLVILRAKILTEFGVKLSDQQIKSCITIKDLYTLIAG